MHRVADGKSAIAAYPRILPDVTLLDLHLPDISGMEVLENIRRRNAMVVMLTGQGDIETAVKAMGLGAENFLTKPIEMSHLMAVVEKAAEKGALHSENRELRARLHPNVKRQLIRLAFVVALVLASIWIGQLIGGGQVERPVAPIPVPLRPDTGRAGGNRDTVYRPPLPAGAGGNGAPTTNPVRH